MTVNEGATYGRPASVQQPPYSGTGGSGADAAASNVSSASRTAARPPLTAPRPVPAGTAAVAPPPRGILRADAVRQDQQFRVPRPPAQRSQQGTLAVDEARLNAQRNALPPRPPGHTSVGPSRPAAASTQALPSDRLAGQKVTVWEYNDLQGTCSSFDRPIKPFRRTRELLLAGDYADAFQSKNATEYLDRTSPPDSIIASLKSHKRTFLEVYFPLLPLKETDHDPRECAGKCNGGPHGKSQICRFCKHSVSLSNRHQDRYDAGLALHHLESDDSTCTLPRNDRQLILRGFNEVDRDALRDVKTSRAHLPAFRRAPTRDHQPAHRPSPRPLPPPELPLLGDGNRQTAAARLRPVEWMLSRPETAQEAGRPRESARPAHLPMDEALTRRYSQDRTAQKEQEQEKGKGKEKGIEEEGKIGREISVSDEAPRMREGSAADSQEEGEMIEDELVRKVATAAVGIQTQAASEVDPTSPVFAFQRLPADVATQTDTGSDRQTQTEPSLHAHPLASDRLRDAFTATSTSRSASVTTSSSHAKRVGDGHEELRHRDLLSGQTVPDASGRLRAIMRFERTLQLLRDPDAVPFEDASCTTYTSGPWTIDRKRDQRSYLEVYFPYLAPKPEEHSSRECYGICDGQPHPNGGPHCRFCRKKIGIHRSTKGLLLLSALSHLQVGGKCTLANDVRSQLCAAFVRLDKPIIDRLETLREQKKESIASRSHSRGASIPTVEVPVHVPFFLPSSYQAPAGPTSTHDTVSSKYPTPDASDDATTSPQQRDFPANASSSVAQFQLAAVAEARHGTPSSDAPATAPGSASTIERTDGQLFRAESDGDTSDDDEHASRNALLSRKISSSGRQAGTSAKPWDQGAVNGRIESPRSGRADASRAIYPASPPPPDRGGFIEEELYSEHSPEGTLQVERAHEEGIDEESSSEEEPVASGSSSKRPAVPESRTRSTSIANVAKASGSEDGESEDSRYHTLSSSEEDESKYVSASLPSSLAQVIVPRGPRGNSQGRARKGHREHKAERMSPAFRASSHSTASAPAARQRAQASQSRLTSSPGSQRPTPAFPDLVTSDSQSRRERKMNAANFIRFAGDVPRPKTRNVRTPRRQKAAGKLRGSSAEDSTGSDHDDGSSSSSSEGEGGGRITAADLMAQMSRSEKLEARSKRPPPPPAIIRRQIGSSQPEEDDGRKPATMMRSHGRVRVARAASDSDGDEEGESSDATGRRKPRRQIPRKRQEHSSEENEAEEEDDNLPLTMTARRGRLIRAGDMDAPKVVSTPVGASVKAKTARRSRTGSTQRRRLEKRARSPSADGSGSSSSQHEATSRSRKRMRPAFSSSPAKRAVSGTAGRPLPHSNRKPTVIVNSNSSSNRIKKARKFADIDPRERPSSIELKPRPKDREKQKQKQTPRRKSSRTPDDDEYTEARSDYSDAEEDLDRLPETLLPWKPVLSEFGIETLRDVRKFIRERARAQEFLDYCVDRHKDSNKRAVVRFLRRTAEHFALVKALEEIL